MGKNRLLGSLQKRFVERVLEGKLETCLSQIRNARTKQNAGDEWHALELPRVCVTGPSA